MILSGHFDGLFFPVAVFFAIGEHSFTSGTNYCLLPKAMDQTKTKLACISRGMTLAQPKTMESWNNIADYVTSTENGLQEGWIDIEYVNSKWTWGDGTVLDSANLDIWKSGQPDNLSNEKCARVVHRKLANQKCSFSKRPLCQYEPNPTTRDAIMDRVRNDQFPKTEISLYDVITGSTITCMLKCLYTPRCASYAVTKAAGSHSVTCWLYDSIVKTFKSKPGSAYFVKPCLV